MASPAVERRNARARAAGFRNYYEQRIRGGVRKAVPGSPRPTGEALARARGHRGHADAIRAIPRAQSASITGMGRDSSGRFTKIAVILVDDQGDSVTYSFDWDEDDLEALIDELDDHDVPYVAYPTAAGGE